MSYIDATSGDLEAMSTGLALAQESATAADNAAVQIAQQAAGSGFAGVAQNMGRLCKAIREIRAGIAAVAETVTRTRTSFTAASKQPSPGETIAVLAPVVESLGTVHDRIAAVVETVNRAKQLAAAILQGGQPGPMLARLDTIREVLVTLAHRGNGARQLVETALAEARKTGHAGNLPRVAVYPGRDHRHPTPRPPTDPRQPIRRRGPDRQRTACGNTPSTRRLRAMPSTRTAGPLPTSPL